MPIITLTTDWKASDYYVGSIKGKILSLCPASTIIDITHQIPPFNINQAAFVIRNCYYNFPPACVHIVAVNSEGGKDSPYLAIEYDAHYFISTDNGIIGLICSDPPEKIIRINAKNTDSSFAGFSVFAETACKLACGDKIESLGTPITEYF